MLNYENENVDSFICAQRLWQADNPWKEKQLFMARVRAADIRKNESEEHRRFRQEKDRLRMAARRAAYTELERLRERKKNAERIAARRAFIRSTENPEERKERLLREATRQARRRALMTEEEKRDETRKNIARRAAYTEQERLIERKKNADRVAARRAFESVGERRERQLREANRQAMRRALMTGEEKKEETRKNAARRATCVTYQSDFERNIRLGNVENKISRRMTNERKIRIQLLKNITRRRNATDNEHLAMIRKIAPYVTGQRLPEEEGNIVFDDKSLKNITHFTGHFAKEKERGLFHTTEGSIFSYHEPKRLEEISRNAIQCLELRKRFKAFYNFMYCQKTNAYKDSVFSNLKLNSTLLKEEPVDLEEKNEKLCYFPMEDVPYMMKYKQEIKKEPD